MIIAWRVIVVVQRGKGVRAQGATRCKRNVHFLKNGEKEYVSTPKINEQIEGVLTAWRRQKKGQGQDKGN